jgi:histidine phosphotransfer protein HptB
MNTFSIYSSLADDPDLGELVEMFVQEMPDRINTLKTQAQSRDWKQLARTAHQLKGAAGSYGFEAITPCAERLIIALKDAQPEDRIFAVLDELVDLCLRLRSDVPPTENDRYHDMPYGSP